MRRVPGLAQALVGTLKATVGTALAPVIDALKGKVTAPTTVGETRETTTRRPERSTANGFKPSYR